MHTYLLSKSICVGKTGCHAYHSPVITISIDGMYKQFWVMGGYGSALHTLYLLYLSRGSIGTRS